MWSEGANPYAEAQLTIRGDEIFGPQNLCCWLYSPHVLPFIQGFSLLQFETARLVWAGVGMALIVLVGIFWFREPLTALKLVFLGMIAVGTVGLKLLSDR